MTLTSLRLARLLALAALLAAAGPLSALAQGIEVIGVPIADRVRVQGVDQDLWLRGHAQLDRNMLPWYTVVLHGDRRVRLREAWGEALEPCRVTLVWLENLASAETVHAHFSELFASTLPATALTQMAPQIEEFIESLPAATRSQRWRFDYWPDGGMQFFIDDQEVRRISGFDLNKAILGLWLGTTADNTVRALLTEKVR